MFTQEINSAASMTLKGGKKVTDWLDQQSEAAQKANQTAVKIEGYRLMRLMRSEIKKGAPGGKAFAGLTYIARRMSRKVRGAGTFVRQSPNRKPLVRTATAVRYAVTKKPFSMSVGFVNPAGGNQISTTWRRLAKIQQAGFTRQVTKKQRVAMARRGGELGTVDGGNTPFFLKKTTKTMTTPARPIIAPFWQAHQNAARANIRKNFKRKMAGERI